MIARALLGLVCLAPQAKVIASRSSEKRLEVAADDAGAFLWTLRGAEGVEWERTMPHNARMAHVCEDGTVVVYGAPPESADARPRSLSIVGPASHGAGEDGQRYGELRLAELHPITEWPTHTFGFPEVTAVLAWETLDTCAFWVRDIGKPEQLWTYALSDGSRKGVLEPQRALAKRTCDDWELLHVLEAVAPGSNELFVATFVLHERSGGNLGQCGIVALFRADGEALWHERLFDQHFTGAIQVLESTADVLRCTVETYRRDEPRPGALTGRRVEKLPLALYFRRAGDAWKLE